MDKYTTYCSFFSIREDGVFGFGGAEYSTPKKVNIGLLEIGRRAQLIALLTNAKKLKELLKSGPANRFWKVLRAFAKIQSKLGINKKDHDRNVFSELTTAFCELETVVAKELDYEFITSPKKSEYCSKIVEYWGVIEPITLLFLRRDCYFSAIDCKDDDLDNQIMALIR